MMTNVEKKNVIYIFTKRSTISLITSPYLTSHVFIINYETQAPRAMVKKNTDAGTFSKVAFGKSPHSLAK